MTPPATVGVRAKPHLVLTDALAAVRDAAVRTDPQGHADRPAERQAARKPRRRSARGRALHHRRCRQAPARLPHQPRLRGSPRRDRPRLRRSRRTVAGTAHEDSSHPRALGHRPPDPRGRLRYRHVRPASGRRARRRDHQDERWLPHPDPHRPSRIQSAHGRHARGRPNASVRGAWTLPATARVCWRTGSTFTNARDKTREDHRKIAGTDANAERLAAATGLTSQPCPAPETGGNCVRTITDGGDVVTAIRAVP